MTKDTMKSMAMLKKSLKMNRYAVEKNQKDDGTTDTEVKDRQTKIDILIADIEAWEKLSATVPPVGIVQPDPAAPVISTVPDPDDDLLTVP
jgi:hypothetical protein